MERGTESIGVVRLLVVRALASPKFCWRIVGPPGTSRRAPKHHIGRQPSSQHPLEAAAPRARIAYDGAFAAHGPPGPLDHSRHRHETDGPRRRATPLPAVVSSGALDAGKNTDDETGRRTKQREDSAGERRSRCREVGGRDSAAADKGDEGPELDQEAVRALQGAFFSLGDAEPSVDASWPGIKADWGCLGRSFDGKRARGTTAICTSFARRTRDTSSGKDRWKVGWLADDSWGPRGSGSWRIREPALQRDIHCA